MTDTEEDLGGRVQEHAASPAEAPGVGGGTVELAALLATMEPELCRDEVVFCSFPGATVRDKLFLSPQGSFEEREGLTLVVRKVDAERHGVPFHTVLKRITLTVHSSLEAVGLTAAVAGRLAAHGISANVVAAYRHDHVFVPARDAERALQVLWILQAEAAGGHPSVGVTFGTRLPSKAELAVQGQFEAYNARDIDAFMRWWAEDCRYYAFPDQLLASGAAAIRERHLARFREPNLHGRLVKRIAVANVVVEQEVVTRTFLDGPGEVDVVAIYEVDGGKIANAWFKMGLPRLHPAEA